jgi:DNA polymerase V
MANGYYTDQMTSIVARPSSAPIARPLAFHDTLVPAGFPSPAADYVQNTIDLHERLVHHPAATFFVRVSGDSMIDTGIVDGSILVVDASRPPQSGDIVVAAIDGKYTVKRLQAVRGQFELHAENSRVHYPPLRPSEDLQIFGVVTSHIVEHIRLPGKSATKAKAKA